MVANQAGLHARSAVAIAKLTQRFQADVALVKEHQRAACRDVLQLLMLGAGEGTELVVEASGLDAEIAVVALAQFFGEKFQEE